ncbi:hypothetical protein [Agrococcus sp. ARC_14]|uniref:hypothetical protein n=1 Tax=Agrococcus sp. ARC_14 TaxID=2919927 RepID=UPI001F070AE5|nr:hypothetical protein [Agrococcus sp. ARC_14]MCH1881658.1 hypothetical protein [Agrococcus sp. ARC_14]
MGFDLGSLAVAVISVLGVGLLLGAGIPLIYALAVRSHESDRPGSAAVSVALIAACVLLAIAGIVMIVFGDAIFGG